MNLVKAKGGFMDKKLKPIVIDGITIKPNEINTLKKLEKFRKKHFPNGIEEFKIDSYIGCNLIRITYNKELPACLHAMTDLLSGKIYYSYGFEQKPYVKYHKDEKGKNVKFEVWTT
jgi:hypothetical protein